MQTPCGYAPRATLSLLRLAADRARLTASLLPSAPLTDGSSQADATDARDALLAVDARDTGDASPATNAGQGRHARLDSEAENRQRTPPDTNAACCGDAAGYRHTSGRGRTAGYGDASGRGRAAGDRDAARSGDAAGYPGRVLPMPRHDQEGMNQLSPSRMRSA